MKEKQKGSFSPVILLVFSLIAVGTVGYLLVNQGKKVEQAESPSPSTQKTADKDSEGEEKQSTGPSALDLEVIDYTKDIEDICQAVEFKLKIKNLGEGTFTLQQLENRDYILAIDQVTESTESARLDEAAGIAVEDKLQDFDQIDPGKEKEITYLGMDKSVILDEGSDPVSENIFVGLPKNGKYDLKFVVEKRNEDGSREIIAESESFDINQKSLIEEGIFKACH